jgi:hypothetical protein
VSTVKTNNVQVGQSATATNNFTLYQPSTPDGTVRLGVGNTGATTADVASFNSSGVFAFNSGYGSAATAYGCRAWVRFSAATGTPTINGSGNVSSLTDLGVGLTRVNFTTAMPDGSYNLTGTSSDNNSASNGWGMVLVPKGGPNGFTTGYIEVATVGGGGATLYDAHATSISIFR